MKIELVSDLNSPTGYSSHARALVRSLVTTGVDLRLSHKKSCPQSVTLKPETTELYMACGRKPEGWKPDVRIMFETPYGYNRVGDAMSIGFFQWETDRIPDRAVGGDPRWNWVTQINKHCDVVWTSSRSAADAMERAGVTIRKEIVAGPVDDEMYCPEGPELQVRGISCDEAGSPIPRDQRKPVIGLMADWTKRKNVEAWIAWLTTSFRNGEVEGLLKVQAGFEDFNHQTAGLVRRVQEIRKQCRMVNGPTITLVSENLTDEECAEWFRVIDIYVSFSRGEGFGLPVLQAMAMNKPVVHTGWGAPADYIDTKCGYLVPYVMEPVWGMEYTPYWGNQCWAYADTTAATAAVRQILNSRGTEGQWAGREVVKLNHSISATAEKISRLLRIR